MATQSLLVPLWCTTAVKVFTKSVQLTGGRKAWRTIAQKIGSAVEQLGRQNGTAVQLFPTSSSHSDCTEPRRVPQRHGVVCAALGKQSTVLRSERRPLWMSQLLPLASGDK